MCHGSWETPPSTFFDALKLGVVKTSSSGALLLMVTTASFAQQFRPEIPKTWDDAAVAALEVPLAYAPGSPVHVTSDYYYRMKPRAIFKSYPVYHPSRVPAGYWDWLRQQEPKEIFDPLLFASREDWIAAGEIVFDAATAYNGPILPEETLTSDWYQKTGMPLTRDGVMPFYRYVVRTKGKVELGTNSCATCHTRILADGSVLKGTQGNFPFDRSSAFRMRARFSVGQAQRFERSFFGAPWLDLKRFDTLSLEEIITAHEAIPPGVAARSRSDTASPVAIGDLIGIIDRKYLDRTGLVQHRGIGDLMRYSALAGGLDDLSSFNGFIPRGASRPAPESRERYTDEQLYALALYIYSLKPPKNPNPLDATAARGETIFKREGCGECHTPPLYTNNRLIPVSAFRVPDDHQGKYDIMPTSIDTDPSLTMRSRRGTGYYKVPSLRGVWYRGPFAHSGSVQTLEEWFDPARLRDDFLTSGWVGRNGRAVRGHEFGLKLSVADRKALIAFLKTL